MAGFLYVPEKSTDAVKYAKTFNSVLATDDVNTKNEFSTALEILDALRKDSMSGHQRLTFGIPLVQALSKYLDQLRSLENAFPPQSLRVTTTWKNAFTSPGLLMNYRTTFSDDKLEFEKTCVMFNLASCMSRHASNLVESIAEDHLKEASQLFQKSAGVFQYIRHVSTVPAMTGMTNDLHLDTLMSLEKLMLAQAQECVFLKAYSDHYEGKPTTTMAKLAKACADDYKLAWKFMKKQQPPPCNDQWSNMIQFKLLALEAAAQIYRAQADHNSGNRGDELARLQLAMRNMKQANRHAECITAMIIGSHWKAIYENLERELRKKSHDNEYIYREKVTMESDLPVIEAVSVVKTNPPVFPLTTTAPLFERFSSANQG